VLAGGSCALSGDVRDPAVGARPTRRETPHDEAKALDGMSGRDLVHTPQDLRSQIRQFVGPDRRGALDRELAAAKGLRARAAGHGFADGARPRGVRARLVPSGEPVERRRDDVAHPAREVVTTA
jgi:hypothetical protein